MLTRQPKRPLHILDHSGKILKNISPLNNSNFVHPRFVDETTIIVTERLANATMQMARIDLSTNEREVLIPSTSALLGYPYVYEGFIYFVSSVTGMDDIYSISLTDKKIFQLVSGHTGKYYPSVYKDSLVWSAFTSNGLKTEMNEFANTTDTTEKNLLEGSYLTVPGSGRNILFKFVDRCVKKISGKPV
jgi:hypothetical protein